LRTLKPACTPNSAERHASLKAQFDRDFAVYNNTSPDLNVNVELVDRCVSKLKGGKAAVACPSDYYLFTYLSIQDSCTLWSGLLILAMEEYA